MSRRELSKNPSHIRQVARYGHLRDLGYGWRECQSGARHIERFRELVIAKGRDPDEYGECGRNNGPGGWPRPALPYRGQAEAAQRKRRYWELRALGACAAEASEGMGCEMGFLRVKRALKGSVFK